MTEPRTTSAAAADANASILRRPATWVYVLLVVAGLVVIVPRFVLMLDQPDLLVVTWLGGAIQAVALLLFGWVMLPKRRASAPAVLLSILIGATFCTGSAITLVNIGATLRLERFVVTPIIEEVVKLVAVLVVLLMLRPRLRGPLDGLIIGYFVAFGFTIVENMLYTSDAANITAGWQLVITRLIFQFGTHVLYTAIAGAALAYVVLSRGRKWWLLVAAFASVLAVHLLWDVLGLWLAPLVYLGAAVVLGAAAIVAFVLVRRACAAFERRADAVGSAD
ncbi:Membrane proteinase PrsW, cleaves anti-sigma factor RsiW, M82 family [Microbacterium sp. cf046]|uniref:PrsW family glutamic-type intramembrane protease n=1 Tax=Microbacterium sp. cf046 TaxID=1761803 RepID=UPI0008E0489B|nr:PrsW family glutamic-type intramembrane protease [Microbacterium sp. cf046]SFS07453.1 Membrane proteinase PrsW, cleaves anti-sigma factor RsiW, M82 family [Microbacterium sp. cf046]